MPTALPSPVVKSFSDCQANFDAIMRLLSPLAQAIVVGNGSPESAVTAPVGTIYRRADGGVGTTGYAKTSGSGNTGWTAFV